MIDPSGELINKLAQVIYDKKGFNILALDVRNVSNLTDYFIIAEGNVERHVQAIAKDIMQAAGELGLTPFHVDGERIGDWVVIDCGSIVIHLFISEMREKYSLEEVWKKGTVIDLELTLDT